MLVADLRHFLDLPDGTPATPVHLAEQLRGIVRAATAGDAEPGWVSALPGQRRRGHRNLRFHVYDRLPPSRHVDDLLAEIDRDPTGIFWG